MKSVISVRNCVDHEAVTKPSNVLYYVSMRRNNSLKKILIQFFLISFFIPIGIAIFSSYYFYSKYYETFNESLVTETQEQLAEEFDLIIGFYENILFRVGSDMELNSLIKSLNTSEDEMLHSIYRNKIYQRFAFYGYNWEEVGIFGFIDLDHHSIVYDKTHDSMFNNLAITQEFIDQTFQETFHSEKVVKFHGFTMLDYKQRNNLRKNVFTISIPAYTIPGKHLMGVFFMTIDTSLLDTITGNTRRMEQNQNVHDIAVLILDGNGIVMTSPWINMTGMNWEEAYLYLSDTLQISIRDTYRSYLPVPGWEVNSIVMNTKTIRRMIIYRQVLIGVAIFMLIGISLAIFLFTRSLTRDVHRIIEGMQKLRAGNLGEQIPMISNMELGMIVNGFNSMSFEMKNLVNDLHVEKEKVIGSIKTQKNLEIQLLEAQINPHFIYNTLDSISWMAINHDEYEISEMLSLLGEIIRYSTVNSNDIVPLSKELTWLEQYLVLQEKRFSNPFKWELKCDDKAMDFMVPKLTLQPIVENAVIHGLLSLKEEGEQMLHVSCELKNEYLTVKIADNGAGISPKIIAATKDACQIIKEYKEDNPMLKQQDRLKVLGIGIVNTLQRLYRQYGSSCVFEYSSRNGGGTVCTLLLPENHGKYES